MVWQLISFQVHSVKLNRAKFCSVAEMQVLGYFVEDDSKTSSKATFSKGNPSDFEGGCWWQAGWWQCYTADLLGFAQHHNHLQGLPVNDPKKKTLAAASVKENY